ncbi:MAG: hypothetical protein NTV99_01615 [Deltaproteobacteria bacterium]|nr:hypothetical protein [Deltaproteobacteria bacterium]
MPLSRDFRQYESEAMGIIILIGTLFWLIHLFRSRKLRSGHIQRYVRLNPLYPSCIKAHVPLIPLG